MPDFFFIECTNVFRKWVQRRGYPAKWAREHLRDLIGLGLTVIPAEVLASDALDIALKHGVTAYDACYIAATGRLKLPLITADERLAGQVAKGPYEAQWLGDFELLQE